MTKLNHVNACLVSRSTEQENAQVVLRKVITISRTTRVTVFSITIDSMIMDLA